MNAAISPQQRHTRANRCPICDGADGDTRGQGKRCSGFTSADGEYVHCSRSELAGAIEENSAGLFAHRVVVPLALAKDVTDVIEAGGCIDDLVPLVRGAVASPKPMAINDVTAPDELPEIWPGTDISQTVTESIAALAVDPELFVRGGALTRVIESDGTDSGRIAREKGAPVMRRVTPPFLTERLSIGAAFMKAKTSGRGDSKSETAIRISPPSWIATHVLARETWPGFRSLTGVVTSPTMRRDGSVLQTAGYDAASGLLYTPRGQYPRVPDAPTGAEALAACGRLLGVVEDFPLGDTAKAAWLSLLFTLVARELVDGSTPLFAIDAPTAGSGKGLLARVPHIIAYGSEVAHMSMPPTDDELRKQITTTLLSGDPAVLLDNVGVQLGGDSIEAIITAPVWKVRLLGKNEDSGAIVPRLVWIASGNGLEFIGDMGRRTLRIRIDTRHELAEAGVNEQRAMMLTAHSDSRVHALYVQETAVMQAIPRPAAAVGEKTRCCAMSGDEKSPTGD